MKYQREIKVGILAVVTIFLLVFGFNYLKGVNIFSQINSYYGAYDNINGLEEQAPVYIRGCKVGHVEKIQYDFTKSTAFLVTFSIDRSITLPKGTTLALIADGILGGSALEVRVPTGVSNDCFQYGDTIPTIVVPGVLENLQTGVISDVSNTLHRVDSMIAQIEQQLEGDHIKHTLANVEELSSDLEITCQSLRGLATNDIPPIVTGVKTAIVDVNHVTDNLAKVDFDGTVQRVDSVVTQLYLFSEKLNDPNGTVGKLLNDNTLYFDINKAVASADSLLVDLKANPKRYVHFSLFGAKKDKK